MATKYFLASLLLLLCSLTYAQSPSGARLKSPLKNAKPVLESQEIAIENLQETLGIDLKLKSNANVPGGTIQRWQQTHNGIDVLGAELITKTISGKVDRISGKFSSGSLPSASPSLTEATAVSTAKAAVTAETYFWEIDPTFTQPTAALIYWTDYPGENTTLENSTLYKLAYQVDLEIAVPLGCYRIFVDALNGEILEVQNRISTITGVQIPGATLYDGVQNIDVEQLAGGDYVLRDFSRAADIRTFSADNDGLFSTSSSIADPDGFFDNDSAGVSVHWASQLAYDYFLGQGIVSYDNDGGPINSWVHFENDFNNAFYYPGQGFYYGDGAADNPFVSLDVVGHEFTHAISEYSAKLTLKRESGAILESFCDIFGEVLEKEARGANDWLLGDCLVPGGIRDMSDPGLLGHPSFYEGPNWIDPEAACLPNVNDNCGVHSNCGVQNFWFYLLSEGGSGTNPASYNYAVSGIGIDDAAKIAFTTLTQKLTYFSDYYDVAEGSIEAAQDLIAAGVLTDSTAVMDAIIEAWCAVGLGPCSFNTSFLAIENIPSDTTYYAGETISLNWASLGTIDSTKLEYSINGGASWSLISTNLTDSNFTWTVPDVYSTQVLVRVVSEEFLQVRDEIDEAISIVSCELTAAFTPDVTNSYCAGNSVNFTATQPQTGAIQYRWYLNGNLWAVDDNLSAVIPTSGSVEIELEVFDGLCQKSRTANYSTESLATAFDYIVNFNEVELLAPLAESYSWDLGGLSTADTRLTSYIFPTDTVFDICLTTTNSCGTVTNCESITTASPTASCAGAAAFSIDSSICQSNTYLVSPDTISGSAIYRWTVDGDVESFDTDYLLNTSETVIREVILEYQDLSACSDSYGKFVQINPSATSIELAENLLSCDTPSILLEVDPALNYDWKFEGSPFATTSSVLIDAFGLYTLTVTDACNLSVEDSLFVAQDNSCVYPGDLNFDGIVNQADLLPLGTYFGLSGPARNDASTAWLPQSADSWLPYDTIDFGIRHVDANGDGIIDLRDRQPILDNFGNTHDLNTSTPIIGGLTSLQPEVSALSDSSLAVDILLTADEGLVTAYGAAFTLSIPSGQFGGINSVSSDLSNSWLGDSPDELIELIVNQDTVLPGGETTIVATYYGVTRIDQANRVGVDDIVKMVIVIDADLPSTGDSSLVISLEGAGVVNNLGDLIPVNFNSDNTTYGFSLGVNCDRPSGLSNTIGEDMINLTWNPVPGALGYQIRGRKSGTSIWARRTIFPAQNNFSIPTGSLDPGIYEWNVQAACQISPLVISDTSITFTFVTIPPSRFGDLDENISLFPNPTAAFLTVESAEQLTYFRIVNVAGMVLKEGALEGNSATIKTADLPDGTYFIELSTMERSQEKIYRSFTIKQ